MNDNCFGGKQRKENYYDWSKYGRKKLKLLVMETTKNPNCVKDAKSLEVDYHFNKKICMVGEICEKWLL